MDYPAYNYYLKLRARLSNHDTAYPVFMNLISIIRPNQQQVRAGNDTDIIIDGFPRSANTYFTSMFEVAQGERLKVARHLHDSYQIRFGEQRNIPTVVLIRRPVDAISSRILRDKRAHPETLFQLYLLFYTNVVRHYRKSVIADFSIATQSPNKIISEVNSRYQTDFLLHDHANDSRVKSLVRKRDLEALGALNLSEQTSALPSSRKNELGKILKEHLKKNFREQLLEADALYETVLDLRPA